ncbi:HAMP domain-containing protein [Corallococcus sp. AB004]|uniref:sensor histidine kinase n=1 Tax=Corallococcus sp. AB038B TaxID=2316718 RepID=UPI000EA08EF6|nr:HAMP domain-containing sensor histidine kinase [Corallococcus sp. AB038B]RKI01937.1 HAMP domain-containing protein [Corallococcus sp. AB038B]RKI40124.1 HAMP domain-containing protein [Corallococcus sp. AB004]
MKLRLRLALTAVAVTVPAVFALVQVEHSVRRRTTDEVIIASTLSQMQSGGRERCEATPETWMVRSRPPQRPPWEREGLPDGNGGPLSGTVAPNEPSGNGPASGGPRPGDEGPPRPGARGPLGRRLPPVSLYPFDGQFVSRNPQAPALDDDLRKGVQDDGVGVRRYSKADGALVQDLLLRMPWDGGPCEYVLARRVEPAESPEVGLPPLYVWGVPTLILLSAMVVALGPVVQRLRRLTDEVRASSGSRYEQPVTVNGTDEIAELARAFQQARAEIQAQMAHQQAREQTLRDFLANTTHDVMTPLTVLQGHLAAMQQRMRAGEPLESGLMLSAMSEAHYMASLVHNLGAAARLEAGAPQVQHAPVDLNALVSRVLGRHQPIARPQRIALESGVPATQTWVMGDETLLEQAVSNVVLNSIRYGREDGHVAVVLETTRQQTFHLRVIDDGPGISEEERSRILERRFRGNVARTREPQGQGLGLHIVHNVVELHGWKMTLAPSEYGGLEVTFTGPLMSPPA